MILNEEQIDLIRDEIMLQGVTMPDLADSLLDHICCAMEESEDTNFNRSLSQAFRSFGIHPLKEIQIETIQLLIIKKETIMKRTMYILGFIAAFLTTTGILFKIMHWPGAHVLLVVGISILNFGFLPMYFYDRFKQVSA